MSTLIGEVLVSRGLVSEPQIHRALDLQRSGGCDLKLGSILMICGAIGERGLQRVLSDLHGVPSVPWRSLFSATRDAIRRLPSDQAFQLNAVPYAAYRQVIGVAFAHPSNDAIARVGSTTGMKVFPAVAPDVRILQAHQRFYGRQIDARLALLISGRRAEAEEFVPREEAEGAPQLTKPDQQNCLSRFVEEALLEFERRSLVVLRVRDTETDSA